MFFFFIGLKFITLIARSTHLGSGRAGTYKDVVVVVFYFFWHQNITKINQSGLMSNPDYGYCS